jgi:hypothetical protein
METNVSIPGRDGMREVISRSFQGRCESKAPGGGGKAPDGEKKPGLGIPQPGDKEESDDLSR